MIGGNLLQQVYNLVDTLIVGQYLGAQVLAAVGSAYTLMVFLTSILIGLGMMGCALASLVLTVVCGYFVAQVASGFSRTLRNERFDKIAGFGKEEMDHFSVPSLIVRTTEDVRQV